jgi:hypothetical protein
MSTFWLLYQSTSTIKIHPIKQQLLTHLKIKFDVSKH